MGTSTLQMEFTNFLEEKYRKFFRFLDVAKVGHISVKTFHTIAENVLQARPNGNDNKVVNAEDISKWWQPLEALTDDGCLDESRFISVMAFVYSDPKEFENFQLNCESGFALSFRSINANKSDNIALQDLCLCYKWFGITDRSFCNRVFVALDTDCDGLVSRREYLEALHKYFFSNDRHAGCNFIFG